MKIKVKLEIGISIIAIVMIFLIIRLKNSQFVIPWFDNTPLKV